MPKHNSKTPTTAVLISARKGTNGLLTRIIADCINALIVLKEKNSHKKRRSVLKIQKGKRRTGALIQSATILIDSQFYLFWPN